MYNLYQKVFLKYIPNVILSTKHCERAVLFIKMTDLVGIVLAVIAVNVVKVNSKPCPTWFIRVKWM